MPRKKFPLFLHSSGQYAKKIRGRTRYFGKHKEAALRKYREERDAVQAGFNPRDRSDSPELRQTVNAFLSARRKDVDAGELSLVAWNDYYRAAEDLTGYFGKTYPILELVPADFTAFKAKLAKT